MAAAQAASPNAAPRIVFWYAASNPGSSIRVMQLALHTASSREPARRAETNVHLRAGDATGARAETGQHVGKRTASAGRSSLSASCCPASWQTTRKPSGSQRKSEPPWNRSTETSSLKWEQLGGFCRAKEEFDGFDVVVSYLINKGDNYENHDNSTSNCVDPPEYVRPCARWDEHGKSRHSPLQHGRCGRSYRNPTQECFWEYASSHRA